MDGTHTSSEKSEANLGSVSDLNKQPRQAGWNLSDPTLHLLTSAQIVTGARIKTGVISQIRKAKFAPNGQFNMVAKILKTPFLGGIYCTGYRSGVKCFSFNF